SNILVYCSPTTRISTLSLHDALPILRDDAEPVQVAERRVAHGRALALPDEPGGRVPVRAAHLEHAPDRGGRGRRRVDDRSRPSPRSVIADTPANGFVDAPSHEPRELRPVARSTTCWYPNAPWSVQYGTPVYGLVSPDQRTVVPSTA